MLAGSGGAGRDLGFVRERRAHRRLAAPSVCTYGRRCSMASPQLRRVRKRQIALVRRARARTSRAASSCVRPSSSTGPALSGCSATTASSTLRASASRPAPRYATARLTRAGRFRNRGARALAGEECRPAPAREAQPSRAAQPASSSRHSSRSAFHGSNSGGESRAGRDAAGACFGCPCRCGARGGKSIVTTRRVIARPGCLP